MDNNLIKQAWELAEHDVDYQNYEENRMLLEGRSGEHFKDVIMKRVKLKYANGNFSSEDMRNWTIPTAYGLGKDGLITRTTKLNDFVRDIVTSYNVHMISTDILKELALNDLEDSYTTNDDIWMDEKDKEVCFSELFDDCFNYVHGIGGGLLKAVKEENDKYGIDFITYLNYFPVISKYNTRKILAYVEHQEFEYKKGNDKKEVYFLTIYENGKTTMKFVEEIGEEEDLETTIPELELLKQFGFDEDFYNLLVKSNGEIEEEYEGWAVSEVYTAKGYRKVYGKSSYTEGSKIAARDIVVFSTIYGQSMDELLRPKIIMDEGFLTRSNDDLGTPKIEWQDGVLVYRDSGSGQKPLFEQIKTDLKREEVDKTISSNQKQAFIELGINETSTGTTEKGFQAVSAKTIDMFRVLIKSSKVKTAVATGVERILEFIYRQEKGGQLEISFPKASMLTLTEMEKIEKIVKLVENNLMSVEDGISELHNIPIAEATEKAKLIIEQQVAQLPQLYNDEDINN